MALEVAISRQGLELSILPPSNLFGTVWPSWFVDIDFTVYYKFTLASVMPAAFLTSVQAQIEAHQLSSTSTSLEAMINAFFLTGLSH